MEFVSTRSYKLNEEGCRKRFREKINVEIEINRERLESENLETRWECLKQIILDSARGVCGYFRKSNIKKQTTWWNEEIKNEIRAKKRAWQKYLASKDNEDYLVYKMCRRNVKVSVRKAREKSWEKFGNQLEEGGAGNGKNLFRMLRNLRKGREVETQWIKDRNGNILKQKEEIEQRWMDHFCDILGGVEVTEECEEESNVIEERVVEVGEEIEVEELKEAIRLLKKGKSAGIDGLKTEMFKYMGSEGEVVLRSLMNKIWREKKIPTEWQTAILIALHKKGEKMLCENYRGISLLCVASKIYERILERRLRKIIEPTLEDTQAGFRKGRNTQEWIFALRQLCEKTIKKQEKIYISAIDIQKAFDSVSREGMWDILERRQVPVELVQAIKSIYQRSKNVIRGRDFTSKEFITYKGVRQGSILSPLLFIIVMDEVAKTVKKRTSGVLIGYRRMRPVIIRELMYADDLVICAGNKDALMSNVEEWRKELGRYNMVINVRKSEVMTIGIEDEETERIWERVELEKVQCIKYLGAMIEGNGKMDAEINNRIKIANRVFYALLNTFINKREVSREVKLKVYNSVFVPTFIYGAENWKLSERHRSMIRACEMRFLRRIAGVTRMDKISSKTIRESLGVEEIEERIRKRQLSWWGHMVRMADEKIVKQVWEVKARKRGRGRPRGTWDDEVRKILKGRNSDWKEAREMARDRKGWRKFCDRKEQVVE